mgnify:CR=1 FL=1
MKLTFKNDTFKILQIADTQEGRKVSPDTLALINAAWIERSRTWWYTAVTRSGGVGSTVM